MALVGIMGVGKTTTGGDLAAQLGWPLRDSDVDLRIRTGLSAAEIAEQQGIEMLHRMEEQVLLGALSGGERSVITAAGSVVASESCRQALRRRATVVWLDAPVSDALARIAGDPCRRPMSPTDAELLLAQRREHLAEVSHLHLDARQPTHALVERILRSVAV